jgi:hypothetical protein
MHLTDAPELEDGRDEGSAGEDDVVDGDLRGLAVHLVNVSEEEHALSAREKVSPHCKCID